MKTNDLCNIKYSIFVSEHKNTKAFVTHGGLMGTMESIYYGVPMIGIPLFGDQHSNMYHYERQKMAIMMKVDNITADQFTNSIQTVLNDPIYRLVLKRINLALIIRNISG